MRNIALKRLQHIININLKHDCQSTSNSIFFDHYHSYCKIIIVDESCRPSLVSYLNEIRPQKSFQFHWEERQIWVSDKRNLASKRIFNWISAIALSSKKIECNRIKKRFLKQLPTFWSVNLTIYSIKISNGIFGATSKIAHVIVTKPDETFNVWHCRKNSNWRNF
jgi:hypothetical protein